MSIEKVVVLSDQKPGHFNQSLGVAERINGAEVKLVDVIFKSRRHDLALRRRGILNQVLPLAKKRKRAALVKVLEQESLAKILSVKPSVIISAGSSVAVPNLFLGDILGVPSITCGIPSPIGISKFALALVAGHKKPPRRRNVFVTIGAPNRIDKEKLEGATDYWQKKYGTFLPKSGPILGIAVGGNARNLYIDESTMESLLVEIRDFMERGDGSFIITTSRRTPRILNEFLAAQLSDDPRCLLFIDACKEEANPLPMMLAACDVILVSEDSATMISEAASGSTKVVVWGVERGKGKMPGDARLVPLLTAGDHILYCSRRQLDRRGKLQKLIEESLVRAQDVEPLQEAKRCALEIERRWGDRHENFIGTALF